MEARRAQSAWFSITSTRVREPDSGVLPLHSRDAEFAALRGRERCAIYI